MGSGELLQNIGTALGQPGVNLTPILWTLLASSQIFAGPIGRPTPLLVPIDFRYAIVVRYIFELWQLPAVYKLRRARANGCRTEYDRANERAKFSDTMSPESLAGAGTCRFLIAILKQHAKHWLITG